VNHVLPICHVFIQVRSQIKVFNLRMFGMFSGALEKLRKTAISFVMCVRMSVRPSGRMNIPAPTRQICIEFDGSYFFFFFRKSV